MSGPELRQYREAAGVSQEALATEMGYAHHSSISHIENRVRVTEVLQRRYVQAVNVLRLSRDAA